MSINADTVQNVGYSYEFSLDGTSTYTHEVVIDEAAGRYEIRVLAGNQVASGDFKLVNPTIGVLGGWLAEVMLAVTGSAPTTPIGASSRTNWKLLYDFNFNVGSGPPWYHKIYLDTRNNAYEIYGADGSVIDSGDFAGGLTGTQLTNWLDEAMRAALGVTPT